MQDIMGAESKILDGIGKHAVADAQSPDHIFVNESADCVWVV